MAEITLLTYWKVLQKRKKLILVMMIFSAVVTTIMSLSASREYTAQVAAYPPAGSVNIFSGLGGGLMSSTIGGSPTSVESLTFLVKSRRMAEGVVDHFGLAEKFLMTREEAVRAIPHMISGYDLSKGTLFVIEVTSNDPKFSADLANFCAAYLNTINEELNLTTNKPLVKVIDSALPPMQPNPRHTVKKMFSAVLFSGVGFYFIFFFTEYFRMLREEEQQKTIAEDAERLLKGV